MPKILLSHSVIVKGPGLLPMLYTVREISRDLNMSERTLRDWMQNCDVPFTHDSHGHIWINGREFADWVEKHRKANIASKTDLEENEFYCVSCRQGVILANFHTTRFRGKVGFMRGNCPKCGKLICRGYRLEDI